MRPEERFQRADAPCFGSKIANRVDFYGGSAALFASDRALALRLFSVGDFVSRLWARFGPPRSVGDEGFTYDLVDRETGLAFSAYSAGSGPAYGGDATLEVLEVFERWIASTPPVECTIEYGTDFGLTRAGARRNAAGEIVSFEEDAFPRGRDPRGAKSVEDCERIAETWTARDPDRAGWAACLGIVLPRRKMRGEEILDLSETDEGDLAVLVERGGEPVRVALCAIDPRAVRGVARIWLEAWQAR